MLALLVYWMAFKVWPMDSYYAALRSRYDAASKHFCDSGLSLPQDQISLESDSALVSLSLWYSMNHSSRGLTKNSASGSSLWSSTKRRKSLVPRRWSNAAKVKRITVFSSGLSIDQNKLIVGDARKSESLSFFAFFIAFAIKNKLFLFLFDCLVGHKPTCAIQKYHSVKTLWCQIASVN